MFLAVIISPHFSVALRNDSYTLHSPCPQRLSIVLPRFIITENIIYVSSHNISFHTLFLFVSWRQLHNHSKCTVLILMLSFSLGCHTVILNMLWIIFISENQICSMFRKNVLHSTSECSCQRRVSLNLETARYSETAVYNRHGVVSQRNWFLNRKFVHVVITAPHDC